MPRDMTASEDLDITEFQDLNYYCARCGAVVTRGGWEIRQNGDHEHVVFNPAGMVFRILCFRDAPGALARGAASTVFSWFRGYAWRAAWCRACEAHLGWRFEGDAEPRVFFGLIKDALSTAKP